MRNPIMLASMELAARPPAPRLVRDPAPRCPAPADSPAPPPKFRLFSRFFTFPACFFREDCYIIFSFQHGIPSILPDGVMVAQVILVHLV